MTETALEEFIVRADQIGGPATAAEEPLWARFLYEATVQIDQTLDPYSKAYIDQQIALYYELSGRDIDQYENEQTKIDIEPLIEAHNPKNSRDSHHLASEYWQIANALRHARLPHAAEILDMGSGWGVTTEFLAQCGAKVTAVDINPAFVELVRARANRLKIDVDVVHSSFEDFTTLKRFDAILFYQCLHHAVKPWDLIGHVAGFLKPNGKIIIAGEPVQALWWKNWGLRLDPVSVYCIRKFGWFESGWSSSFIVDCFNRNGLWVDYLQAEGEVMPVAAASRKSHLVPDDLKHGLSGWIRETEYLASRGDVRISLNMPIGYSTFDFRLCNFRPKPIHLSISVEDEFVRDLSLPTGESTVSLPKYGPITQFRIVSDVWQPSTETGSQDNRLLSFHLKSVSFR